MRERSGTVRIREYACIPYVDIFLCAKENYVFPVLIPLKLRIAQCFHELYDGIVRWLKPRSTSLLLGTITDLAKGKSELLVENALLRVPLVILHRHVKRPVYRRQTGFSWCCWRGWFGPGNRLSSFSVLRHFCEGRVGSSVCSGNTNRRRARESRSSRPRRSS
jgi:hypothetical protein